MQENRLGSPSPITTRDSSIELLRIVCMLMIVLHHFAVHGTFSFPYGTFSLAQCWYHFVSLGGKVGVNIFMLISGYYLSQSKSTFPSLQRIVKLHGSIIFYSITISILFYVFKPFNITIKSILSVFAPTIHSTWWFASAYFVLYLFHPFINILLNNLTLINYQRYLLLLTVCWSIIPTITTSQFQSNNLLWFVTLYSIAGYIARYKPLESMHSQFFFKIAIVSILITYLSCLFFHSLGNGVVNFATNAMFLYGSEKFPTLVSSLSLFIGFTRINLHESHWINRFASASFGVYLIHDHPMVRKWLWNDVIGAFNMQNSLLIIPISLISSLSVWILCSYIDLTRQKLIERPFLNLLRFLQCKYRPFLSQWLSL